MRTLAEKDYYFYKTWKDVTLIGGIALIVLAVVSFLLLYFLGAFKDFDFYDDVKASMIRAIVFFSLIAFTGLIFIIISVTALRIAYNSAKRRLR